MATPWILFLQALEGRFGDHSLGDPMIELLSLKQTGSFSDYRDRFELLMGRVILSETCAISLFINGLRPCVQTAVRLFTPQTLVHTYALARLQELSSSTREGFSQSSSSKQVTTGDASSNSKRVTNVDVRNLSGSNVNNSPLLPTPIMPTIKSCRLLTPEGMGSCDEKLKQLYRLELEEDVVEGEIEKNSVCGEATEREGSECGEATEREGSECGKATEEENIVNEAMEDDNPLISINAISGLTTKAKSVMVDVAEMCDAICTTTTFTTDVLPLPVGNCDMVLGVQWPETLGDIQWNFKLRGGQKEQRNFEQQLTKQKLLSKVDCLAPSLCLDTEFMSRGRVFDDLQNRRSILKLPVRVQLGIRTAEAEVEEPKHHTERVLRIFEDLELEVKVYSGMRIMQVKPVRVAVANGNSLSCHSLCRGVKWSLQNTFFTTDVLLLLSGNWDMVLEFQWLRILGTIQWDFKNLSMEFSYQGKKYVLRGCAQGQLQSISSKSLDKILPQCSNDQFCYLAVKDEQQLQLHSLDYSGSNMIVDDAVALVLEGHEVVFKEPTSLLLFRDHNHQILLKEGTQAIASRHCRHTSIQKDVIEKYALSRVHTSDIVCDQLRKKGRWVFGNDEGLRKKLIKLFHDSSIGCHSGIFVTHTRLAALSYWPHMEKHIRCMSTGYPPPIHIPYFKGDLAVHALDESLLPREATIQFLKHHLVRAQKRMRISMTSNSFATWDLGIRQRLVREISRFPTLRTRLISGGMI